MSMSFTVVPHVHWDREWYFTEQKSRIYLNQYLIDVLDALEADPRITQYLFDAQTSLVDDFLTDHPEREEQLKKLVSTKRFLTGPWYTQCDQMVVHGESIVRNLLYGTREAAELGHCFGVGYAPDCFGQAAQMPQILSGFGIKYAMIKRGIDTSAIPSDDFIWESDDGSRVFAYHLLDYMNFRNPSQSRQENVQHVDDIERAYESRSLSRHAFLFNGFDQHPLRHDITDLVEEMKPASSVSFGDLENDLARMAMTHDLPTFRGELTSGETTRVHKSIFSSRADIKILNSKVENLLVRVAEPLQAIYYHLTGRHEQEALRRCWKILMESSAHDSIGCCNSDEVNHNIAARLREATNTISAYEQLTYRFIARGSSSKPFSLQVYNYLPYERTEEISLTLLTPWTSFSLVDTRGTSWPVTILSIEETTEEARAAYAFAAGANNSYARPYDKIPVYRCFVRATVCVGAMGYETFILRETEKAHAVTTPSDRLENEFLCVHANIDGTLEILDKRSNHVYHRLLELIDDVDAGDSYDWSSDPDAPLVVSSTGRTASTSIENDVMHISLNMPLPFNRDERVRAECSVTEHVELDITLPATKPILNIRATVENAAVDHRLRILAPTDIPSEYSYADQTFGVISRPTNLEQAEKRWESGGWSERPRTIEPMQSFCYLTNGSCFISVITDSVKEYQVVGTNHDAIAYTLFRSFTKMGRPNLPDRPGRESGKSWDTPDAALLGKLEITFAVGFATSENEVIRLASEYATPLRVHQEALLETSKDEFVFGGGEKEVPDSFSSFSVEGHFQTSIYKLAEDANSGEILRFTQIGDSLPHVNCMRPLLLTNLSETAECAYNESAPCTRNKIVTIRIKEKA